jgi:hypothetical protein
MQPVIEPAAALDLLLNRENPRHEPKRNQPEIIKYLLDDEQVYNLARHISANGVNPLEVVAVFADEDGNLIVAEGNRRICALQLLLDPDKAPADQRARFRTLAKNGHFPDQVMVARFDDYELARPWLKILHDGEQDGIGRRRWRVEQKARFTQHSNTSTLAVKLLDYAIETDIISKEEKDSISLTTMTRYLENPKVRGALGIGTTPTNPAVKIELPGDRFGPVLARFIEDARTGVLHSRSKTPDWQTYAAEIEREFKTSKDRTPAKALDEKPAPVPLPTPRQPAQKIILRGVASDRIKRSEAVVAALNDLKSDKLSSVYRSLTALSLTDHPALLMAGAWMFLESLTALHGRSGTSFESYIDSQMNSWNLPREQKKEVKLSVKHIGDTGNAEKHSGKFTLLDARNLRPHFDVIESVLVRLIQEVAR